MGFIEVDAFSEEMKDSGEARFDAEDCAWRDPAAAASMWREASEANPGLFATQVHGAFWDALADSNATLCISREYEHLVVALSIEDGRRRVTYLRLPHPSGLTLDAVRERLYVASTRNPNQVFELAPAVGLLRRKELEAGAGTSEGTLVPVRSSFLPGCSYLHDLALIDGVLHGNAVGSNAVVRVEAGSAVPVWWPKCIDGSPGPAFDANYLQLNSIAAGASLSDSFFTASAARPGTLRPGHADFPVDRTGVLFSGATREPTVFGLTRPHSARIRDRTIWLDDSGYGELCVVRGATAETVVRLSGWTRGLCFAGNFAFVGTSRVLPRFQQYAPGLAIEDSRCGIHAVDVGSGKLVGSLIWPEGNQIFAIEALPKTWRLPFREEAVAADEVDSKSIFYAFEVKKRKSE